MKLTRLPSVLVSAALAVALTVGAESAPALAAGSVPLAAGQAPLLAAGGANAIAGEYVVVLRGGHVGARATTDAAAVATRHGGTVLFWYGAALTGYAARLSPSALAAVRRDPRVSYVQENQRHAGTAGGVQPNAPWHLDRIDQRFRPLDSTFGWMSTGHGVNAYVVDSGIRDTHAEFGGRVVRDFTSINDGNGTRDCPNGTGHGTFVASELGGRTYGVAKAVTLHAVRILGCDGSGSTAQIVAGMDWVAANRVKPAVANMSIQSFNGENNPVMDQAAAGMINRGVVLVLIAGNFNRGDCTNSPKDPRAIITAASTIDDARNTGPNPSSFGPCVTVFAPGADVTAAGIASDTAVNQHWYGTSMAAPLVAGVLARVMQSRPGLTMAEAKQLIVSTATTGVLANVGAGTPNRLLFRDRTG